MREVLLFNRDGTIYVAAMSQVRSFTLDKTADTGGQVHTMPNGEVQTGATHTASSRRLFYYHELSPERKIRALESMVERYDSPDRTKTSFNN